MNRRVRIVECPRDAWQGLPVRIPAEVKASYLRRLIAAGFSQIDAVSFVSKDAVPQMADSEQVLEFLGPTDGVEIIGIVVNRRGAERAIRTGKVQTLGFPYSVSAEFLRRNQHQTPRESRVVLKEIVALARAAGMGVVAYISMAFGNPYAEPWSIDLALEACDRLLGSGVQQISLADTVGLATSVQVSELVAAALAAHDAMELGVHLHARRGQAASKVRTAYQAGCRRFDAAIGGLGGCPFAQDNLVGNIPTEILVEALTALGAQLPELRLSDALIHESGEIARDFGWQ